MQLKLLLLLILGNVLDKFLFCGWVEKAIQQQDSAGAAVWALYSWVCTLTTQLCFSAPHKLKPSAILFASQKGWLCTPIRFSSIGNLVQFAPRHKFAAAFAAACGKCWADSSLTFLHLEMTSDSGPLPFIQTQFRGCKSNRSKQREGGCWIPKQVCIYP